jgi:hypothetical protein
MRFHLLVPAIAAILISIQPVALAQSLTTFQPNLIDSIDEIEIYQREGELKEQNPIPLEEFGYRQHLQIATSDLLKQAVNPLKSSFQAKLPGLTVSVNLPELQEWTQTQVSNIGTQIATVRAWSNNVVANTQDKIDRAQTWGTNLAVNTQDKIGRIQTWSMNVAADTQSTLDNIQEWSTDLVSNLSTNLQNLQEWGTDLVSNLKLNLFTLSKELNHIQQELEATGNPEEIAEIQKVKAVTANVSKELGEIQQAAETTAILSEEVDEIQQAAETTEEIVDTVAASETLELK